MKWLKRIGIGFGGLLGLIAIVLVGVIVWSNLEYGPQPIFPHQRVTITLPFAPANDAQNLIPMGEKIAHPNGFGHPGIDFQWDYSAPLIAVADGTVTSITPSTDMGQPVTYLTLRVGGYVASYKELDKIQAGVVVGSRVKQGDVLAYPHGSTGGDGKQHYQVHWEFAYASIVPTITMKVDRLCPLTYFDPAALARIDAIWARVPPSDKFKSAYPNICSGAFYNHDQ